MPVAAGTSKKKLSAQGNNLTKYWGTPLPRSKKSPGRTDNCETREGETDGGDCLGVPRGFEVRASPHRLPSGTPTGGGLGRGGTARGAAGMLEGEDRAGCPAEVCLMENVLNRDRFFVVVSVSPQTKGVTCNHTIYEV